MSFKAIERGKNSNRLLNLQTNLNLDYSEFKDMHDILSIYGVFRFLAIAENDEKRSPLYQEVIKIICENYEIPKEDISENYPRLWELLKWEVEHVLKSEEIFPGVRTSTTSVFCNTYMRTVNIVHTKYGRKIDFTARQKTLED